MKFKLIIISSLMLSNLTLAQTLSFEKFPFNHTALIKIVSYTNRDSTYGNSCISMPQLKDGNVLQLDFSKMEKVKSINLQQASKLYEIATEVTDCPEYKSPTDCSDIKRGHGIIFINEFNEIFAVIDFCFECNYWSRYPGETFEPICPQKMKLISKFFTDNGFE